jgi:hypothetical protein
MIRSASLAAVALGCSLAGCAPSRPPVTAATPAPYPCLETIDLTEEMVSEALAGDIIHFAGRDGLPPFVAGYLSYLRPAAMAAMDRGETVIHGTVLFVRENGGWTARAPSHHENAVAIHVAKSSPSVFIVAQTQIEGPGQAYTFVRSTDGLQTGLCTEIPFPEALNNPEWRMETLAEPRLQIDTRGRGELVAAADRDTESETPRIEWYRYDTDDGGAGWSAPVRLPGEASPSAGDLIEVSEPAPEQLTADLAAFARGR